MAPRGDEGERDVEVEVEVEGNSAHTLVERSFRFSGCRVSGFKV
jgi:hypothetical protein